jgi:hypothetical protein
MKIKDFFARQEARREMVSAETVHHQVDAFTSSGAASSDALAMNVDLAFVEEMIRMVADIGTGLWRMRQKMVKPGTDEPLEEMRRVYRHFESVWDSIVQAGADIQDHTDDLYSSGTSLRVIAFQPTADIERETVTETLKPTIYFRGRLIQMGEVIVATPENNA